MPTLVKCATYFKKVKLPKGRIDLGKYRIVKPVTPLHLAEARREIDIERRNMFYLRNPFTTAKELNCIPAGEKQIAPNCLEKHRNKRIEKFLKCQESRKIDVFLKSTLKRTDAWE